MLLAEQLIAMGHPCELISVDSMQVYRQMEIGTAAPTVADRSRVPHHMVSICEPHDEYSVAEFAVAVRSLVQQFDQDGITALLVGGTALYWQTIIDQLELPGQYPEVVVSLHDQATNDLYQQLCAVDPAAAEKMEPTNRRRILRALEVTVGSGRPFSTFGPGLVEFPATPFAIAGIQVPREYFNDRIEARFWKQIDAGFLDELRQLNALDPPWSRTASRALGYHELQRHLEGEISLDDAVQQAVQRIRQFSVRQIRWFRRDPRITWFDRYQLSARGDARGNDDAHDSALVSSPDTPDVAPRSDEDLAAEIFTWWTTAK